MAGVLLLVIFTSIFSNGNAGCISSTSSSAPVYSHQSGLASSQMVPPRPQKFPITLHQPRKTGDHIYTGQVYFRWTTTPEMVKSYTLYLKREDEQEFSEFPGIIVAQKFISISRAGRYFAYVKTKQSGWFGSSILSNQIEFKVYQMISAPTISGNTNGKHFLVGQIAILFVGVDGAQWYTVQFQTENSRQPYRRLMTPANVDRQIWVSTDIAHSGKYLVSILANGPYAISDWSTATIFVDSAPVFTSPKYFFVGNVEFTWVQLANIMRFTLEVHQQEQSPLVEKIENIEGTNDKHIVSIQNAGKYQVKLFPTGYPRWSSVFDFVVVQNAQPVFEAPKQYEQYPIEEVACEWKGNQGDPAYQLEIFGPKVDNDNLGREYVYHTTAISQRVHTFYGTGWYQARVAMLLDNNRFGVWSNWVEFYLDGNSRNDDDPAKAEGTFIFHPVGEKWMRKIITQLKIEVDEASIKFRPESHGTIKKITAEPPDTYEKIEYDGACLFHTFSYQTVGYKGLEKKMRMLVATELSRNKRRYSLSDSHDDLKYITNMGTNAKAWGTELEIKAAAYAFQIPIWVFGKSDLYRRAWRRVPRDDDPEPVLDNELGALYIWNINDNHYVPITDWDPVF